MIPGDAEDNVRNIAERTCTKVSLITGTMAASKVFPGAVYRPARRGGA